MAEHTAALFRKPLLISLAVHGLIGIVLYGFFASSDKQKSELLAVQWADESLPGATNQIRPPTKSKEARGVNSPAAARDDAAESGGQAAALSLLSDSAQAPPSVSTSVAPSVATSSAITSVTSVAPPVAPSVAASAAATLLTSASGQPKASDAAAQSSNAMADRPPAIDARHAGNTLPSYPVLSRRLGEQGVVVLQVFISPDGRAAETQIKRSSGSRRLDEAAMEAVRGWRFIPATRAGAPIAAWYEWAWEFRLNN